ncbi:MAG: hypothetical protein AAGJ67_01825 [Pseudomonadota bacterium]
MLIRLLVGFNQMKNREEVAQSLKDSYTSSKSNDKKGILVFLWCVILIIAFIVTCRTIFTLGFVHGFSLASISALFWLWDSFEAIGKGSKGGFLVRALGGALLITSILLGPSKYVLSQAEKAKNDNHPDTLVADIKDRLWSNSTD